MSKKQVAVGVLNPVFESSSLNRLALYEDLEMKTFLAKVVLKEPLVPFFVMFIQLSTELSSFNY